ncbi:MAG: type II toxin-antitoxin system Phd/YefM family antitoxin [Neisseria sp.]|nr:type II toxin-antitoxin system Phd/YefM family antitoxin [Neisseria sp.]
MSFVNIFQAKTNLSRLVESIEQGEEPEIIIARNGRPAARLVAIKPATPIRIGLAKGVFTIPDDIDVDNEEIAQLFSGESA